jgi:hypothetical protein
MKMKIHILNKQIFILILFLNICNCENNLIEFADNSYYYEEKYFRILSNNYDTIDPGNKWREEPEGFGFKARRDFGSLILLKDWSMYNFKLTKVVFRNQASFDYGKECDAEMWLIHTKDNGYYPPGRRIFIKQNYFIIVVPFIITNDQNPAVDSIFEVLGLGKYADNKDQTVFPSRPVKLYTIIQNQPSLLFEGNYRQTNTLFLVFTQYHFIAERDFNNLLYIYGNGTTTLEEVSFDNEAEYENKIFRNVRNIDEVKPKVTLMSYSLGKEENKAKYLESLLFFIIIFLF